MSGFSPQMEVEVSGKSILCAGHEQKAENDCTQNSKAEVNIDVGEQPALSYDIRLKNLDSTQNWIRGCPAIVRDQTRVLR
jgi:hypothetical protein